MELVITPIFVHTVGRFSVPGLIKSTISLVTYVLYKSQHV